MSDLVKRLRLAGLNPAEYDSTGWTAKTCGLVSSAADRIEQLERVLLQAREAMKLAVSANNFRAACLCSDAPMQKIDFAETEFWRAMDNLANTSAIDEALK